MSDIFSILKVTKNSIEFIISSEETSFRHLYYVKAALNTPVPEGTEEAFRSARLQPEILKKVPLTSGKWVVDSKPIKVNLERNLVFFHGYKDTPTEKHGYIVCIDQPEQIRRLTYANYSHSCDYFEVSSDLVFTSA